MDRFTPQAAFVPASRLLDLAVTVIGVGAIGRQLTLQLASIGVLQLQLIDFDQVDTTNVTTQGYAAADIGLPKVESLSTSVQAIDPSIRVTIHCDRYRRRYATGHAVFCCVDKIAARAAIWRSLPDHADFWCDGRMHGEVIRILAASPRDTEQRNRYAASLFHPDDAHAGSCTSRSTIYAASIAAGLMTQQFCRWLRSLPLDSDLTLNLLASELTLVG